MNLLVILFILTYFVFDSNLSRPTTAERCFKKNQCSFDRALFIVDGGKK